MITLLYAYTTMHGYKSVSCLQIWFKLTKSHTLSLQVLMQKHKKVQVTTHSLSPDK